MNLYFISPAEMVSSGSLCAVLTAHHLFAPGTAVSQKEGGARTPLVALETKGQTHPVPLAACFYEGLVSFLFT